ncbi:MAG: sigma-70 family RNA polymerase sigma factor [Oscillospiraceae bacterium]|nr:sigma-70 family RNA polymerase sigma factor [Oscillospiraceae bacterium]
MDAELLEQLYRKYYAGALLYCTALCGDEELAKDLTADAFVKAYLSLPDEIPSFRYWLLRVCKNLWLDHLRKHRREISDEPLQFLADNHTPETWYLQDERRRCLWQAIGTLPPNDREMLILHYFSGLSLQEIAPMTGKSYGAVRQRMVRLRQTLKIKMEEQGYGMDT